MINNKKTIIHLDAESTEEEDEGKYIDAKFSSANIIESPKILQNNNNNTMIISDIWK